MTASAFASANCSGETTLPSTFFRRKEINCSAVPSVIGPPPGAVGRSTWRRRFAQARSSGRLRLAGGSPHGPADHLAGGEGGWSSILQDVQATGQAGRALQRNLGLDVTPGDFDRR